MDQFWKQFVGSGTGSEHKLFLKARLKLTALYVLVVAVIVFGFSIFLYQSLGHNLRDVSDDDFVGAESHQRFVDHTLGSVENNLILADLFILVFTGGLSFVLAGKTLKPIQQSIEAQKAFASNASHELRTPLAVMRNDIEVYLRNTSQTKELTLATMNSNLDEISHMSGMVEDLLVLARSDNEVLPEYKDVDLSVVVKNMVEKMRSLTESKKIKLTFETYGQSIIQGADRSLERVILNILQNSIDHTLAGGTIGVKIEKAGSQVVLTFNDTGMGIATKDLPHIFKRFYKGNSAKGTGLGLSIAKEIINQHGGHITVESIEGKSTIVSIRFPVA
jgi:signal transduction histidine kinase